jgi:PAS domain S-box-containing protein
LERKLEQSRQWLNTTLTSIADGVIATDEQGLVRFINPSAMEQIQVRHTEAIGKLLPEVFTFIDEESRQPIQLLDLDSQPLQASGNRAFAGLLVPCSGDPFPVEAKLTSISDGKGGVYGMVLIFRNVTQQR